MASTADYAQAYSGKTDGELAVIAGDVENLSFEACLAFEAELRRRGLADDEAFRIASEEAHQTMDQAQASYKQVERQSSAAAKNFFVVIAVAIGTIFLLAMTVVAGNDRRSSTPTQW